MTHKGQKHDEAPVISAEIVKRAQNPSYLGEIPGSDGYAYLQGDCGDSLEVFLSIRDQIIEKARFDTLGCGFTLACGSAAMELAENSTATQAHRIQPEQIANILGGLPPSHFHCAELAADALKNALKDYLSRRNDPWKKMYRTRRQT